MDVQGKKIHSSASWLSVECVNQCDRKSQRSRLTRSHFIHYFAHTPRATVCTPLPHAHGFGGNSFAYLLLFIWIWGIVVHSVSCVKIPARYLKYCLTSHHYDKTICSPEYYLLFREGTFFIGRGGPGLQRGGSNLFYMQPGEGHSFFFGKEKITPSRLVDSSVLFVNKHAKCIKTSKLSIKINLNYFIQVSKFYLKKLSCAN